MLVVLASDVGVYDVVEGENAGGMDYVGVQIDMTYRNATDDVVFLHGCKRPSLPVLQKWQGGAWVLAWGAVEQSCGSTPVPIPPGETYAMTVPVMGYLPGQNAAPTFDTEVEGTYRLLWTVYTADEPREDALLPLDQRVSNTFELRLQDDEP